MKTSLILIVLLCVIAIATAKRWRGGRRRYRYRSRIRWNYNWNHGFHWPSFREDNPCMSYGYRHKDSEVIACEFRNSMMVESRACPGYYSCTSGPITVTTGSETGQFKFCNLPVKKEDACKWNCSTDPSSFRYSRTPCPPGVPCAAGPLVRTGWSWYGSRTYNYYFCGQANSSLPTSHFYQTELKKKACSVNGAPVESDCSGGLCDGITLQLQATEGTLTLGFCNGTADPDFRFLNLWGTTCIRGQAYQPNISVTPLGTMAPEEPTTPPVQTQPSIPQTGGGQPPGEPIAGELPVVTVENGTIVTE